MIMRPIATLVAVVALAAAAGPLCAQDPRLQDRLPSPAQRSVDALLDSARAIGLPTEPLVDRALEGASKGASGERIVSAVTRLFGDLRVAHAALGPSSAPDEITAGASALRAGAAETDLRRLRRARPDGSVTVATAVLADLVAVGVPVDTAVAAVLALSDVADDADYIAFRRNVERDVALGASPVAALGVRLDAAAEALGPQAPTADTRPRKP
jgi:hypothetical protein